jgi:hypothetical protein
MAAIVQPHRHLAPFADPSARALHPSRPVRPALRLVPSPVRRPRPWAPYVSLAVGLLLVVAVALGAVAIGRGALAGLAPAAPGTPGAAVTAGSGPAVTVVVQDGDTLWTIARRIQPSGDVRALVDRLAAVNGSTVVHVGDHLRVRRS